MIRYLSKYVSRNVLDQIYKLYVRPHLDYGDMIYHRYDPEMQSHFTQALEQTQYSAALQSVTKLLSHPQIFSLFAPVFPPPP